MKTHTTLFLVLGLLAACGPVREESQDDSSDDALVVEEESAQTKKVKPNGPQMEAIAPFAGNWKCTGTFTAIAPIQVAHTTKSTCKIAFDLGGNWLHARCDETKATNGAALYAFEEFWGWDAANNRYNRTFNGNLGDYGKYTTSTIVDGKMDWAGVMYLGGSEIPMKDTVSVSADGKIFKFAGDLGVAPGVFVPQFSYDCHK